jgi:hypothetical protein
MADAQRPTPAALYNRLTAATRIVECAFLAAGNITAKEEGPALAAVLSLGLADLQELIGDLEPEADPPKLYAGKVLNVTYGQHETSLDFGEDSASGGDFVSDPRVAFQVVLPTPGFIALSAFLPVLVDEMVEGCPALGPSVLATREQMLAELAATRQNLEDKAYG